MAKHGSVLATAPIGGAGRVAGPSTPGTRAQTRTPLRGAEWRLDQRNLIIKPRKITWVGVGSPKDQRYGNVLQAPMVAARSLTRDGVRLLPLLPGDPLLPKDGCGPCAGQSFHSSVHPALAQQRLD